jgi:DNA repair protein RadC
MDQEMMKPEWCQVADVELVYRTKVKPSQRPKISTSADAYEILQKIWNRDKIELVEEFKVLLLNRSNKVLGVLDASSGGITGTVADPRIILAAAIKANAIGVVLSHNHPSGSVKPSRADEELTVKIREAARFLDMTVLDHIIITSEGYYSFADEGLL